jgi:arginyl-tRNA synthetase
MSALSKIEPELAKKTKHIGHGMVRLKTGKMSSRLGNILTGEWLLNEVKQRITAILNQSEKKYSEQEKNDIAEVCAVAAVKYSLLKVSLPSNIDFDIDESINTEGDSGPYLLYTYARCKSVLTKSSKVAVRAKIEKLNTQERALAMLLCRFGEEVEDAALRFAPNILASYLFKLAQSYNTFYAKHQILGNDERLCITDKTASVLQKGLNLLGIETVEEM